MVNTREWTACKVTFFTAKMYHTTIFIRYTTWKGEYHLFHVRENSGEHETRNKVHRISGSPQFKGEWVINTDPRVYCRHFSCMDNLTQ